MGIPALAEALVELLDTLDVGRVILVDDAMGCPVSLEVEHIAPSHQALHASDVTRRWPAQPAACTSGGAVAHGCVSQGPEDGRSCPSRLRMLRVVQQTLTLFAELTRFLTLERILRSAVPTLAVIGTRDPLMSPPRRALALARLAQDDLTVVIIEGRRMR